MRSGRGRNEGAVSPLIRPFIKGVGRATPLPHAPRLGAQKIKKKKKMITEEE
jgi:hypothetical protein